MPNFAAGSADTNMEEFAAFGTNPGNLLAWSHVPAELDAGAPLVVVLHGCTQSAASYDRGAGWTSAADEHGFAVLFPEQQRANNPNLCFNWFSPADAGRGRGEALSIIQMVEAFCARHAIDPGRVYVTGLSAGGAMAAAMLATYPEVFAGGAVIGGLPFGTAANVPEALERMRGQSERGSERLAKLVRSASNHRGKWPILSVWHGGSDRTVDVSNAAALVEQWRGLHGVPAAPSATERLKGQQRLVWCDQDGVAVIEEYIVGNMGHGTPIDVGPANQGEAAGPYMLDVGISSTRGIIGFWGLDRAAKPARAAAPVPKSASAATPRVNPKLIEVAAPVSGGHKPFAKRSMDPANRVQDVIEKALKSAGLMR